MENNQLISLEGLNALICGSTSGMGRAAAHEFASSGASVTLFARNEKKLKETLASLDNSLKQNHTYIIGDFNEPDHIKKIIHEHINDKNIYHILINNSGGPKGGPISDADTSEFIESFNRHLICNHVITQALLEGMRSFNYGRIINIISTSVKQPIEGLGVSNTIRGAVASWSKTLSFEVARHGITVNNLLPGFTDTDRLSSLIQARAKTNNKSEEAIADAMKDQIPIGRFAKPEEIAKVLVFLASPAAGYINGVNLAVDGGRLSCM